MSMSTGAIKASLKKLQKERQRLLKYLVRDEELAVGTVSVVHRKCGNPNCHCASGPGHPQTLFLFKNKKGIRRCKLVRRADEAHMLRAGERYRKFRKDLKQLRAIDRQEKQILMALSKKRALRYD